MWKLLQTLSRARLPLENTKCTYSALYFRNSSNTSTIINVAKPRLKKQESVEFIKWLVLVIPVGSFVLGCWQVRRLQWKLNLIDMLKEKTSAAAVPLPQDFSELESMEYAPVKIRGRFLHEKEILIGPRALVENDSAKNRGGGLVSDPSKNQGWMVVTPFVLSDTGEVILVNRGWVPQRLKPRERRPQCLVSHELELTGVVRLTEQRQPFMMKNKPEKGQWFYRDLHEMGAHVGCQPVWIDARGIPDPPEGWPIPNQTRVTLRNEHFSYLVTWFSLSGFTSYMWYKRFVKRMPLV